MYRWITVLFLAAVSMAAIVEAPLADAAEHADQAAVETLLSQGAKVDAAQVDGMTALHWAAYNDELEMARRLIRAGANVAAENRYGVMPLSLAAQNGGGAMVRLLLAEGADVNTSLPGGETALMTAARTGRIGAVAALIAGGADVNRAEQRHGQTALMWAAAEGHAEVVKALIAVGADFKTPIASGFTPLLFAVREGRMDAARVLVKAGAGVNEEVPRRRGGRGLRGGATPLLLAASNAHFELAAMLLDAGADPNADGTGYTVLHVIAPVRNPGVGDNDPPPTGSGSMTSLEFVRKLIASGANVNARMTRNVNLGNTSLDKLGATPLFLAAQSSDVELIRVLAELGADPLIPNHENTTPLMAAAGVGTRSPGEDAGTGEEIVAAMKLLLDLGADINAADDHRETAMHGAAYKNAPEAVEFLAARGADIRLWNTRNEFGWTPLIIAAGYRFGNFKPSQVTMDALRKVMLAAGVTPPEKIDAKSQEIY